MLVLIPRPLAVFLERWQTRLFPSTDDLVWQEWLDAKPRGYRDVLELLGSDIRLSLRGRALLLLLVPTFSWVPFTWRSVDREDTSFLWLGGVALESLPSELLASATELISAATIALRETPVAFDHSDGALEVCADYLHQLLVLLPEQEAEAVFALWSPNDSDCWWSPDSASGYKPLERLLRDERMPVIWKEQADARMRAIIEAEVAGMQMPRASHEEAVHRYACIVSSAIFLGKLPYPKSLLANQLTFLLGLARRLNRSLIAVDRLEAIFAVLAQTRTELCYQLLEAGLLLDTSFCIYCEETLRWARDMHTLVAARNSKLAEQLARLIELGEHEISVRVLADREAATRQAALLDRMK